MNNLLKQIESINLEIGEINEKLNANENGAPWIRVYRKVSKKLKALESQRRELVYQIELEKGLIWDNENWVTHIYSKFFTTSLEDARQDLLDRLSKMHGVKIIDDGKGVKLIEVLTKNKIYQYTIHACHCVNKVGTKKVKALLSDEMVEENICEQGYQAFVSKNVFNGYRNEFYYE